MSFGGFLDNNLGGGGARIVADIPYSNGTNNSNDRMPSGAISQPRLLAPTVAKSIFNSPGLSLALVRYFSLTFIDFYLKKNELFISPLF